ncbi:MAG: hypothetical protein PHR77_18350 [Kiritimatiellae bacterium]|nr:hypothetical protein [Kiritimatiellia bacterium]MDD5523291.1 hypothetical protein [Kiritimatiellia bacterium]
MKNKLILNESDPERQNMKTYFYRRIFWMVLVVVIAMAGMALRGAETTGLAASTWKLGAPVVTYWAGPAMTDVVAKQMADGGFNLVWCTSEQEMNVAQQNGLRAQFHSGLISPASLDNPAAREKLDALVAKVRTHPALYCYFIRDEPCATDFAGLGRIVAYLRERDPNHMAYINLFPTYANNKQLGTTGDTVTAYREHLRQYIDIVKPALLSYDNYRFAVAGDMDQYFLNLAMIRQAAQQAGLPFLNIVQAASWAPSMRVPTGDEMRYLVYTTLAYGAQGISYYVYCCKGHTGGIALLDGTPTPIYHALKSLNREFVAIATELQPLSSLGMYHAGMTPTGTVALAEDAPFRLDPPVASMPYVNMKPVQGILLGYFGQANKVNVLAKPTHVLVVNLDYKAEHTTTLIGPGKLEVFDATARTWSPAGTGRAELRLSPGGGKLVRQTKQGFFRNLFGIFH